MLFSEMTNKELKSYILELHDCIYGEQSCYGSHDLTNLDNALMEADKRGLTIKTKITL